MGFGLVWVSERLIGKEPMHNQGEFHQHNSLRVIKTNQSELAKVWCKLVWNTLHWTKINRFQFLWNRFIRVWQNLNNWFVKNRIGGFSFIKTARFLKCAIVWITEIESHFLRSQWENTLGNWEVLDQIQLGIFLKNHSWPIHCAVGILQDCAKASSARQPGSLS